MQPFERDALYHMIDNVRALAMTLGREHDHSRRLMNWAQIMEDWQEKQLNKGAGNDTAGDPGAAGDAGRNAADGDAAAKAGQESEPLT